MGSRRIAPAVITRNEANRSRNHLQMFMKRKRDRTLGGASGSQDAAESPVLLCLEIDRVGDQRGQQGQPGNEPAQDLDASESRTVHDVPPVILPVGFCFQDG